MTAAEIAGEPGRGSAGQPGTDGAGPGSACQPGPGGDDLVEAVGQSAGRGLRWSLVGTVVMKLASFGMGLILARLLAPSDFGVYAIALSVTQFAIHINDVGIIAAVVQWRDRFDTMVPTATTMAIAFSATVYGLFWLAAPALARLAGNSSATGAVRLLTLTIVIDGITAVRSATLMRTFRQDRLMIATGVGFVANFTLSIGLAMRGWGAYTFVCGQLAASVITGVLVLVLAELPVRFELDREVAAKLMRFGVPLAASLGVEALLLNADYVIVGKLLDPVRLGYYLLAFNTSTWAVSMLGTAIRYVSIPAFARLSDRETDSLSRGVQRSLIALVTVVTPIVALMSTMADDLVSVLYGPKWTAAAAVLRFLMLLTGVRLLTSLALDVVTGTGATRKILVVNLCWAVVLLPALYAGTRIDGIRGTAIAHTIVGFCVAVPLAVAAMHQVGVRLAGVASAIARPLCAGVLVAVGAGLASRLPVPAALRLCLVPAVGLIGYVLLAVPVGQVRAGLAKVRGALG